MLTSRTLRCLALAFAFAGRQVAAFAADSSTLLDPETAFRISARALDERAVEVEFRIAEGYYLYRDRFRFETEDGKVLADAELPAGKIKHDAFFGRSETYRDRVRIRVPLSAASIAKGRVKLKVTSQGCSDQGVCYIPQEQWIEVRLASGMSRGSP